MLAMGGNDLILIFPLDLLDSVNVEMRFGFGLMNAWCSISRTVVCGMAHGVICSTTWLGMLYVWYLSS